MKKTIKKCLGSYLVVIILSSSSIAEDAGKTKQAVWKPVGNRIMTRWGKEVNPQNVWPEYPRPTMVRQDWKNLNGLWDYAIVSKHAAMPDQYQGKILVPFAVESALSGVGKIVGRDNCLWYRRTFTIPSGWKDKKVLLNFGAVDWESRIWVNDREIGTHRGGYDPFSFDITDALKDNGEQELVIRVWDPTDENNATQPRGKQVSQPSGIFYTAVTGIWQTIWIEPVQNSYIESVKITPDIDKSEVTILPVVKNAEGFDVRVTVLQESTKSLSTGKAGELIKIKLTNPKLWSPDSPFLYDAQIQLVDKDKKTVDSIKSYFGMRKISLDKDEKGIIRLFLNNKPLFQFGPLDQGWWPDGLYTAPSDDALKYDLEITKQLGFNMFRKHVKSEPERLYYWADKLGLLVWQDMPSSLYDRNRVDKEALKQVDQQWELELKRLIDRLYNHPCIIMWVAFNEGWGQYDTERITKWIKEYDPTRLVDNASGWTDMQVGDVSDRHQYPNPGMNRLEDNRASVLGEFGGLGLPIKGHLWQEEGSWGYRQFVAQDKYAADYVNLITQLYSLVKRGLAAAVYTQTTDCETEINGLMTYDRAVTKIDPKEFSSLNRGFLPPRFGRDVESFIEQTEVTLVAADDKAEIHYTTDGSTPKKESSLYKEPIKVDKNMTIKACCFWPNGEKSVITSKTFAMANPISAVKTDIKQRGLKFEYFKGSWDKLPDFSKLTPARTGTAEQINISCANDNSRYGLRFTGYIKIPKTEVYSFYTNSDDGTKLFISGKEVVTNDGVHGMEEAKGDIAVEAGWHPIELIYFQGEGGQGLEVQYEAAGIRKMIIPSNILGY
jgi:hypothetical protein